MTTNTQTRAAQAARARVARRVEAYGGIKEAEIVEAVGRRLKEAREKAGLTLYQAAGVVGLFWTTIARHEAGDMACRMHELLKYTRAYGVTMRWLLHDAMAAADGEE